MYYMYAWMVGWHLVVHKKILSKFTQLQLLTIANALLVTVSGNIINKVFDCRMLHQYLIINHACTSIYYYSKDVSGPTTEPQGRPIYKVIGNQLEYSNNTL